MVYQPDFCIAEKNEEEMKRGRKPIQDEFTNLPISSALKYYYRTRTSKKQMKTFGIVPFTAQRSLAERFFDTKEGK